MGCVLMSSTFNMTGKTEFALLIKDAGGKLRDVWMWLGDEGAASRWSAWQTKQPLSNGDVILGIVKAPMIWTKTR